MLQRTAACCRGRTLATEAACGRCGSGQERPDVPPWRGRRVRPRACVRKPTLNTEWGRACASRRASTSGQQGHCNGRAVGAAMLDHASVAELAMRLHARSMAATRRMKACASSRACGLAAGIASSLRANASRSVLAAGASSP